MCRVGYNLYLQKDYFVIFSKIFSVSIKKMLMMQVTIVIHIHDMYPNLFDFRTGSLIFDILLLFYFFLLQK